MINHQSYFNFLASKHRWEMIVHVVDEFVFITFSSPKGAEYTAGFTPYGTTLESKRGFYSPVAQEEENSFLKIVSSFPKSVLERLQVLRAIYDEEPERFNEI